MPVLAKFPVLFPVSREFTVQTGPIGAAFHQLKAWNRLQILIRTDDWAASKERAQSSNVEATRRTPRRRHAPPGCQRTVNERPSTLWLKAAWPQALRRARAAAGLRFHRHDRLMEL